MAKDETEVPVPESLMEEVANALNLMEAYFEVKANKGKPGIDNMSVDELGKYLFHNRDKLSQSLLDGTYKPEPVKRVEIEKPGGGTRKLGVPTDISMTLGSPASTQVALNRRTAGYGPVRPVV